MIEDDHAIEKLPDGPRDVQSFATLLGALLSQPGKVAGTARARIGNPLVEMAPVSGPTGGKAVLRVSIPDGCRFVVAIGAD